MKFLVLGSGMMGKAIAYDLAQSTTTERVLLADADETRARETAHQLPSKVRPLVLDVNQHREVVNAMKQCDVAIGAVSYRYNVSLTKAALESQVHYCDLGGNDEVIEEQLGLDAAAKKQNISVIPNCGLAPGLANILGARTAELFDSVDSMRMRVGGLPQHPLPPFNYQIVFSAEGLLNEYSGKSKVIRNFKIAEVDTLTEIEAIAFPSPFGILEAFHTSGGASMTPKLFEGKIRELDYKTIRYPGHCERFRTLLDLGFGSDEPMSIGANVLTEKEVFIELLKKKIPQAGPDVVLMKVDVEGIRSGKKQKCEITMIDYFDESRNISAMMRGTAYPTSVIAQFLASGVIANHGVITPEQCVPLDPLLAELRARGMTIIQKWT